MSQNRANAGVTHAVLTAEEVGEIRRAAASLPDPTGASIEALRLVQRRLGWVSDAALREIAGVLRMSPDRLDSIATFYNLIHRRPVGRHVVLLCDGVSCWMLGCDRIREEIRRLVGISPGETSADGRFTLLPMACLGACDRAPVLMIDDDTHRELSPDRVAKILEEYP